MVLPWITMHMYILSVVQEETVTLESPTGVDQSRISQAKPRSSSSRPAMRCTNSQIELVAGDYVSHQSSADACDTNALGTWRRVAAFCAAPVSTRVRRWHVGVLTGAAGLATALAAVLAMRLVVVDTQLDDYRRLMAVSGNRATVVDDGSTDAVTGHHHHHHDNDTVTWNNNLHLKKQFNPYLDDYDLVPEGELFSYSRLEEYVEEEAEDPPYFRLPSHLEPYFYKIELLPWFEGPRKFQIDGRVEIDVVCIHASNNITLDQFELLIDEETVVITDAENGRQLRVRGTKYQAVAEFYVITIDETLIPGRHYRVQMEFESHLNDLLVGFYRSYYDFKGETRVMAVSQFEATEARRAFPCFDEPHLKANFSIILGRKASDNWTSISNMPLHETVPNDEHEGYVWDKFETTPKMSTYLVALCVSQLGFRVHPDSKFRVWSRPEMVHMSDDALEVGVTVLNHYEQLFAAPYPLEKMDLVAVSDFAQGAMENWGLVTFREQYLLFDGKLHSADAKFDMVTSVAHEMAHQWFGDLVTLKWWTDLWLNEGFATFMSYEGIKKYAPNWPMDELFLVDMTQNALELDCLLSSHAVMVPVEHPDEIAEIFDVISYEKGAALLRMMQHSLGPNTFFDGVRHYIGNFSYRNAESDDLWLHIEYQARQDAAIPHDMNVKGVMDTWTLKQGYPVVTLVRNYSDPRGMAIITQDFL
ncbi:unnamed protein product [Notodromas monacha]|uniref:Aminopeptidase n=1 Tax=Notodromas monacha TaxID=399045 RepID=A0A7R9BJQ3_9CRUS|nr:unnamed protein product [Notodromas monacha]CAG0916776.1 unnamed protein product [Notodromas monacha]